ncbi:MAG TPA: PilT/PilU family type 4a pilus ATPase [Actinomycetota bacterium]|jgi:twitching motility protein PilT
MNEVDMTAPAEARERTELSSWLRALVESGGSDLHIKVDSPPKLRVRGRLRRLEHAPLTVQDTEALVDAIVPANRRERFDERGEIDFAYSMPGVGRFRVNAFRQRGSCSIVMRQLRIGGPQIAEIGLPPIVQGLAEEPRGLVLVTGPTGSGKTTTLASMIEHINRTRPVHIVTIEDPIEVLHPDKEASVNQREVGQDTETFLTAIRAALRQDPDVILIGEMRDTETVRAALQAAETGHLVLSTLHTVDATETVNRVVDFFPAEQHHQVRVTLAGALRGIISQRLVPSTDGGQTPAIEVLVNTGRIAERIVEAGATSEIPEVIAQGAYYGMQSFDQHLLALVRDGAVTLEDALGVASEPHDFQLMLQQAGVTPAA